MEAQAQTTNFALAQHFTHHQQELQDLRQARIDLNQTTRVSLNPILNGGPPKDTRIHQV